MIERSSRIESRFMTRRRTQVDFFCLEEDDERSEKSLLIMALGTVALLIRRLLEF